MKPKIKISIKVITDITFEEHVKILRTASFQNKIEKQKKYEC